MYVDSAFEARRKTVIGGPQPQATPSPTVQGVPQPSPVQVPSYVDQGFIARRQAVIKQMSQPKPIQTQPVIAQPQQPKQNLIDKIGSFVSDKLNSSLSSGTKATLKSMAENVGVGVNRVKKTDPKELIIFNHPAVKQYIGDTGAAAVQTIKGAGKLTPAYMAYRAAIGNPVKPGEYAGNIKDFGLDALGLTYRLSEAAPIIGAISETGRKVRQKLQGKNVTWDDLLKAPIEGINKQPGVGEVLTDNTKTAQAIDTVFMAAMIALPFAKKQVTKYVGKGQDINLAIKEAGLDIKPNATPEEVSQAVRTEMKKHPDAFTLNPTQEGLDARTKITKALNTMKQAGWLDKKFASAMDFLQNKFNFETPTVETPKQPKLLGAEGSTTIQDQGTQNGGAQNVLNQKFTYEPAKGLSPEEAAIEKRFADTISADPGKFMTQYKEKFGNVLNTDNVREFSPDYEKNRALYSKAVHEPSSALTKYMYETLLNTPDPQGRDKVVFTAGGTGAGKTTAIANVPQLKQFNDKAKLVYDTNTNDFASSTKRINQALNTGHKVMIEYVHSDPVVAFDQMLSRAKRIGRTVPIEYHSGTHTGALENIFKLKEEYKNNPNVQIRVIDNSLGKGNAKSISLEKLQKKSYTILEGKGKLNEKLQQIADQKLQAGEISKDIYKGVTGKQPTDIQPGSGSDAQRLSKKSQQERPQSSKSVTKTPTKEGIAPQPVGQGKLRKSKAYTRVVDQLAADTRIDTTYNRLNLQKDVENAMKFIQNNPEKALRVGLGMEAPPKGQTETAISIALADRAGVEGNHQLQSQLESSRSLRQTRRGQEIVSERGRFDENSPHRFIQELIDRRMKKLGGTLIPTSVEEVKSIGTGSKKKAVEKIDKAVKVVEEQVKKETSRASLAQDIIDSLIC